jgi:hypothetical protein
MTQYRCGSEGRRRLVRTATGPDGNALLNGIDYLEVTPSDQRKLTVFFLHPLPAAGQAGTVPPPPAPELTQANVVVEGGVRVRNVEVELVETAGRRLTVTVDRAGDFSNYTLRVVSSPTNPEPPAGFDRQLSAIDFGFKVACPSEFDCPHEPPCPQPQLPEPEIAYLAKDYASIRRLLLDRMAVAMPDWRDRKPADLQVALVELLAYAGDYLSYHQDAVATEAYLGTARLRVSIRRHARLLDYPMHDGCNARAWVSLEVGPGADGERLAGPTQSAPGTRLLTMVDADRPILAAEEVDAAVRGGAQVFETLHDLTLHAAHNELRFYTWGDDDCCLPAGATQATLRDGADLASRLLLRAGDVLILEERLGPGSGRPADADRIHRHAVRLTTVVPEAARSIVNNVEVRTPTTAVVDELTGQPIVEIAWSDRDALPFPLCLSTAVGASPVTDVSVARGNVVLADHGWTVNEGTIDPPTVPVSGRYRPRLRLPGITFRVPYDDVAARRTPAAGVTVQDPRGALPTVMLQGGVDTWTPRRDLLGSDRFAPEFVVEVGENRIATVRFGDGVYGRPPESGLRATYRVGNGSAGNVGAEAIAHVVADLDDVLRVRNPLPAAGGVEPEQAEQVRLHAPQAFRTQRRAVTEQDYADAAQVHPDVQKAVATLRWTGSWHTVFVSVDRRAGRPVDDQFEQDLRSFLEPYRMAGVDLEVAGPQYVPLDLVFRARAEPGYYRSDVKAALLLAFSSTEQPGGQRGFFHPDNFTFGQPVFLSRLVAAAMAVPGVDWIDTEQHEPNRFQRWGEADHGELAGGRIDIDRLEVARLDNDPNQPENGRIAFVVEGGL